MNTILRMQILPSELRQFQFLHMASILRNFRESSLLHPIVFETCGSRRDSEHLLIQSYLPSFIQPFSSQYLTSYSSTIGVNIHYATRRNLIHVYPFCNNSSIFLMQLLRNSMEFPSLHPMTNFRFVN